MKLASLKSGRDGELILVDKQLNYATRASHLYPTLQAALDNWAEAKPKLDELSQQLNNGLAKDSFSFDPKQCDAPLPRCYHWADGSAYVTHVELVRKARGAELPDSFWKDPLMYMGASDAFLGPCDDIPIESEDWGIDMEAEIAIITDDVAAGTPKALAADHIQLVCLVNDVSLRNLIPNELAKQFGFYQSKPWTSFTPVAVTPDELGPAWQDNKVHLPLITRLNGQQIGAPNAGEDMTFDFAELIAHAAKSRSLIAGTVIGGGTVANQGSPTGSSCLAELRCLETIRDGKPSTAFMQFGDRVEIEMLDADRQSIFGKISQQVTAYQAPKA